MTDNRKNFYGDRVHPTADYQAAEWYWPTDEEFALIETVVLDGENFAPYIERYGEDNARLLLDHVFREGGTQYLWLAKHLETPTRDNPLTEQHLLRSLEDFDSEVVEPWLAKWGRPYQP